MTRYMLDTDTVSFALRGEGRVGGRILKSRPSLLCISAMTFAELHYGAERKRSARILQAIEDFASPMHIVPFNAKAARRYASLVVHLERLGSPLADFDAMIASHALVEQCTLVTHNTKHFGRVPGLKLADWW